MNEWFTPEDDLPDFEELPPQEEYLESVDWDYLVVMDACRWDVLDYLLDEDPEQLHATTASGTAGWLLRIWCHSIYDWSDVTYISGNPMTEWIEEHPGECLDDYVKEHWRIWKEDNISVDYSSVVNPKKMTNRIGQPEPPAVVHYMQPHIPYVGAMAIGPRMSNQRMREWVGGCEENGENAYTRLVKEGHLSPEIVRKAYEENTRIALREVEKFRNRVDGTVVLTADHGERLGPEKFDHGGPDSPGGQIVPWVEL